MVFDFSDLTVMVRNEEHIVAGFRFLCDAEKYVSNLYVGGVSDNYKVYVKVNENACICYTCHDFLVSLDKEC